MISAALSSRASVPFTAIAACIGLLQLATRAADRISDQRTRADREAVGGRHVAHATEQAGVRMTDVHWMCGTGSDSGSRLVWWRHTGAHLLARPLIRIRAVVVAVIAVAAKHTDGIALGIVQRNHAHVRRHERHGQFGMLLSTAA
jgi:hypothetical protein